MTNFTIQNLNDALKSGHVKEADLLAYLAAEFPDEEWTVAEWIDCASDIDAENFLLSIDYNGEMGAISGRVDAREKAAKREIAIEAGVKFRNIR